jgi:hypothetical protein
MPTPLHSIADELCESISTAIKRIRDIFEGHSAMRWFSRSKDNDVWDADIQGPIGDIEAAQKIRAICTAAADLAKDVGDGNSQAANTERYERAVKTAMQIAMKIVDDLLRDAALLPDHKFVHGGQQPPKVKKEATKKSKKSKKAV